MRRGLRLHLSQSSRSASIGERERGGRGARGAPRLSPERPRACVLFAFWGRERHARFLGKFPGRFKTERVHTARCVRPRVAAAFATISHWGVALIRADGGGWRRQSKVMPHANTTGIMAISSQRKIFHHPPLFCSVHDPAWWWVKASNLGRLGGLVVRFHLAHVLTFVRCGRFCW